MNDELLNYSDEERDIEREIKQGGSPPGGGGRLSTIFLVVLGLHLMVILGVSGFHLLRGILQNTEKQDVAAAAPDSELKTEEKSAQPMVETQPAPEIVKEVQPSIADNAKPETPKVDEPVWTVTQPAALKKTPKPATAKKEQSKKKELMVAGVKEEIRRAIPVAPSGEYTVKKGDTLSKIARKVGASVQDIRQANNLKSDLIKIGQKLSIPGSSEGKRMVATTEGYSVYRVKKGDTLSKIARRFNTTAKNLVRINNIKNPNMIDIGMKLKVPVTQTAQGEKPFRTPVSGADLAMLREAEF